jgi:sulfite exporter TauE/SafE/copper chaperone CopZ
MKTTLNIKGMHCRSCEILVEEELSKVHGISGVYVNHKNGTAVLNCSVAPDLSEISKAVSRAGYSLGTEKTEIISRNKSDYVQLGEALMIAAVLFFIARFFGLFNLAGNFSGNYTSLPVVFIVGLTAGVSSCMALVGGLVLGASARYSKEHPLATGFQKFTPHLLFNLGRIISYIVLGGLIGFFGSAIHFSTSFFGFLIILVGFVMFLLGIQLTDLFPFTKNISFSLPKGLSNISWLRNQNPGLSGAMTFFLPCGFTQAMQLYAISTGSFTRGALTMGVFALGTAPGLLGIGGLTSVVKGSASRLYFKTAGIIVIAMAAFNISNGLNLLGLNTVQKSVTQVSEKTDIQLVDGFQEIRMVQTGSGYSPNVFTVKKGIPVRWIIDSRNPFTCAGSLVSQKLGIRTNLKPGENVFEFTPAQTGNLNFSCSMGMYTGYFNVVE